MNYIANTLILTNTRIKNLVYPELSYQLVGILFEVDNKIGYGHREIIYQRAIAELLRKRQISFKEQVSITMAFESQNFIRVTADFVIDRKVILEIKTHQRIMKESVKQVIDYLKASGLQLGIIATFSRHGVMYRRYALSKNH